MPTKNRERSELRGTTSGGVASLLICLLLVLNWVG